MDLTRLVLIHQPVVKLLQMTRLIRDKRFYLLRAQLINGTFRDFDTFDEYFRYTTGRGESYPGMYSRGSPHSRRDISTRAAFMRDAALFKKIAGHEIDFWYCLTVEHPEITKICLDIALVYPEVLRNPNDFDAINWTPEIIKTLRSLGTTINTMAQSQADMLSLKLYLRIPGTATGTATLVFIFAARRILQSRREVNFNQEIESQYLEIFRKELNVRAVGPGIVDLLISARYLYPIIVAMDDTSYLETAARVAYDYFTYEILLVAAEKRYKFNADIGLRFSRRVTRTVIVEIEKIINNQQIMAMFTETMRNTYLVLAGYIVEAPVRIEIRMEVLNPGPWIGHTVIPAPESLQSLILYSPTQLVNTRILHNQRRDLVSSEIYRTGKDKHEYDFDWD